MATKNYMQLNISNPMLNLTKNTYQNADFTKLESYPYDNMLQPIDYSSTTGNYYNLDNTLYKLDGYKLYRNNSLIKDFTNEIKINTTEYEGKRFGAYLIDNSNTLYYGGTARKSFSNNYQSFIYDNNLLVIDDKIYEFINGVSTVNAYNSPEDFNFNNVLVFFQNGHFLMLEKHITLSDKTGSTGYQLGVLGYYAGEYKFLVLNSDATTITALYGDDGTTTKTIAYLNTTTANLSSNYWDGIYSSFTVDGYRLSRNKQYNLGAIEKRTNNTFYATFFPAVTNSDKNPLNVKDTSGFSGAWNIYAVQGFGYTLAGTTITSTSTYFKQLMSLKYSDAMSMIDFKQATYFQYDEAFVYGFSFDIRHGNSNATGFSIVTELSNGNCLAASDIKYQMNVNNTGGVILRNSSGYAITENKTVDSRYPNFTAYYKEGVLIYYLYQGVPISMPAAFDEAYVYNESAISIYSATSKKTYVIAFSKNTELAVTKVGENLYTNTLYPYYFNKYGQQYVKISLPVFNSKSFDSSTPPYSFASEWSETTETFTAGYIGFQVGNMWMSAANINTGLDIGLSLSKLFNITGVFDLYAGTTGTVSYVSSYNNNKRLIKEIEKEHGVSETSLWQLPPSDTLKTVADYDLYNSYVSALGFTVKLSVLNNEIFSTISIATIDDDIDNIFIIQGQSYMIKKNAIYSFEMDAENGIQNEQYIMSIDGLKYLGYEPTQAYLYDPLTKNVLTFLGSNQLGNNMSLSGLSLAGDIYSWQDLEHQLFVISGDNWTLLKIFNNFITLPFRTDGTCCIYKNSIYLGEKTLALGTGTNHITTGWISLNSNAESPFNRFGAVYVDLLNEGNTDITVSVMTPDREIKTDAVKSFTNTKYIKFIPDTITGLKIKLDITTNQSIVGISLSADEITSQTNTIRSNLI